MSRRREWTADVHHTGGANFRVRIERADAEAVVSVSRIHGRTCVRIIERGTLVPALDKAAKDAARYAASPYLLRSAFSKPVGKEMHAALDVVKS